VVLLAHDGRLFGTFPTYFWSLGDTVVEAIERSLTSRGASSVDLDALG
jgi:hypothetical protein